MPKYVAPKPKKANHQAEPMVHSDQEWRRRISIPVNREILDSVKVGDTVTLEVAGKVVSTSAREEDGTSCCELSLQMQSVATDHDDPNDMDNQDYEDWRRRGGGK